MAKLEYMTPQPPPPQDVTMPALLDHLIAEAKRRSRDRWIRVDAFERPVMITTTEIKDAIAREQALVYAEPLTRVGPVKSGSLREFEEPKP